MEDNPSPTAFQPEFAATATASLDHFEKNLSQTLQGKDRHENLTECREAIRCKNEAITTTFFPCASTEKERPSRSSTFIPFMPRPVYIGGGKELLAGVSDTVSSYYLSESCISDQELAAPNLFTEKDDTLIKRTTPEVLQLHGKGNHLRLKNPQAFVTPASRARSTSKHPTPSIRITPRERVIGKTLANLRSAIKSRKSRVKAKSSAGDQTHFPASVHALLTEAANKQPEIMDWVHDGEAFVVKVTTGKKLERLLKGYFRHGKFTSLQRQLNMYGWSKCQTGKYQGSFFNPLFHRDKGNPSDLALIQRKGPPPSSSKRSPIYPSTQQVRLSFTGSISSRNTSSSEDEKDIRDELPSGSSKVVTLSGRTRVTPVRYTYEPLSKVAQKHKVPLRSEGLILAQASAKCSTKHLRIKKANHENSSKSISPKKRRPIAYQGPPKPPIPIKRNKTQVAATDAYHFVPTPTATTPSKFFADLVCENESAIDATSKFWGHNPDNSAPTWSPLIDEECRPKQLQLVMPSLHPGDTPRSVRMTLFHGTPSFASPMIMSPGPQHRQGGTSEFAAATPASLCRNSSGYSTFGATPIPLPLLRKQSSSFYVRDFMGYIPALQAALGITTAPLCDSSTSDAGVCLPIYVNNHSASTLWHPGDGNTCPPRGAALGSGRFAGA